MNQILRKVLRIASIRAAIIYVLLLSAYYIVALVNEAAGLWFGVILIFLDVAYLWKITTETGRQARRDVLPALATLGMAVILQQPLDYAFGLLSVSALFYRLIELSSPPVAHHRTHPTYRRSGPMRKTKARGSPRLRARYSKR